MKKTIKIYLEPVDEKKLKQKVKEAGYEGRGSTTKYIEKIAREPIVFLDENLKSFIKALGLK